MYVAVFSRRDSFYRRTNIRKMWHEVGADFGDVAFDFVLCQPPKGEASDVAIGIAEERQAHGDVRVMDCEDGYLDGKLTKKVEASMEVFLKEHSGRDYFMKTDDDTFASLRRICGMLQWRESSGKDNAHLYAGVFAEGDETMQTVHVPLRDATSPWYEPESKFPGDVYPTSAKGGPGYMLSSAAVAKIISNRIAQEHVLNNEDKAVGVWVDELVQMGVAMEYVNFPGTDGYDEHKAWIVTSGAYGDYPHFLHHHLTGTTIACLHEVDAKQDPALTVDGCFSG